jgi:NAD+ kinase
VKVALFSIGFDDSKRRDLLLVLDILRRQRVELVMFEPMKTFLSKWENLREMKTWSSYADLKKCAPDYVFSLGGDGTILKLITYVRGLNIPVVGINMGRLGFLANVEKNAVEYCFDRIKNGKFYTEERSLVRLDTENGLFGQNNIALNEFAVLKSDSSSMVTIHAYLNGEYLNSYWCDGLILSTPTGSTAYSLSCGGPIIYPSSANFVLTPVSPHNLNVRPMILPDNVELSFRVEGRGSNFLCTMDSRKETITEETELIVCKASFCVKLVRFEKEEFIDTIRKKLGWGQDFRNW